MLWKRIAPGFVSSRTGQVRQPGADASPHRVTRQACNREPAPEFHLPITFSIGCIKEDPGAEWGPGSVAGWVRGWGLGGTPPGVTHTTPAAAMRSWPTNYFRAAALRRGGRPARPRPLRRIGRQIDLATIGKLKISQMDAKAPAVAAAALEHIARADRKLTRQTIERRTHDHLHRNSPRSRP
jgi:hypothetical protein